MLRETMTFSMLVWAFAIAITIHNIEEAILLPAWSQGAGRWKWPVGANEFRFAVAVLTAAVFAAAIMAGIGGKKSLGAYLVCGYALAMLLNIVYPHVLATVVLREYAPGTLTAILLNLPVSVLLLAMAFREDYIDASTFLWAGPLVVLALAGSIPLLLAIGRRLQSS